MKGSILWLEVVVNSRHRQRTGACRDPLKNAVIELASCCIQKSPLIARFAHDLRTFIPNHAAKLYEGLIRNFDGLSV